MKNPLKKAKKKYSFEGVKSSPNHLALSTPSLRTSLVSGMNA